MRVFKRKLNEHFVHKDGVWIIPYSHLNADAVKVQVWIDDKKVSEESFTYGYHPNGNANLVSDALAYAHTVAKENDLPIYDGSGVEYYTFPDEYKRTDMRTHDSWKPIVDDKDVIPYEYTDQEVDDMDERPRQTAKWAILTAPGQFDIYENVTKNPGRLWDTQLYRGLAGYEGDRQKELRTFFQKNADKVYKGTWADISEGNYTVLVHNRIYESRSIDKLFKSIINAGLKIDGKRISGSVVMGTHKDDWDETIEDVLSFDKEISGFHWGEDSEFLRNVTLVYDALTCAGVTFPKEFVFSKNSEEREYGERKTSEYTLQITDDDKVIMGTTDRFEKFKTLQVGDVLKVSYDRNRAFADREAKLYVVVETDGKRKAKVARCSVSMQVDNSIWGNNYAQILSPRLWQRAMEGDFVKSNGKDDVYTINLLDTDFVIAYTKDDVKEALKSGMRDINNYSGSYDNKNKGYLSAHTPEDPEKFFGEPMKDVLLDSWQKQNMAKAAECLPNAVSLVEEYMTRGNCTKTNETAGDGYDRDNPCNEYDYEAPNGIKIEFYCSLRQPEYVIRCYDENGKKLSGWSGWSYDVKDLTNDLENLLKRYVLPKEESAKYRRKYVEKDLDALFESFDNPHSYLDL